MIIMITAKDACKEGNKAKRSFLEAKMALFLKEKNSVVIEKKESSQTFEDLFAIGIFVKHKQAKSIKKPL